MITGDIKNQVDKIWNIFWSGGIANPLTVIEQFTYLLFMKTLDDRQIALEKNANILGLEAKNIFPKDNQDIRWSKFKHFEADKMYKTITDPKDGAFIFIKNLHDNKESAFSKYMGDAIFIIPTAQMLQKIVENIDNISTKDKDTKGDLYEYLLSKVATSGTNGQFRTPRHIIKMMVSLMKPTPTDTIVDPAAGSAGFLVAAGEYLQNNHKDLFTVQELKEHYNKDMFYGYDMDSTMLRIGAMNMMLHDVEDPNIMYKDSLSEQNADENKFSLVLANPPFKGTVAEDLISPDLLQVTKTKKTELLFLALILRMMRVGGRCAVIVPDGVLFGSSKAHKSIRKEIIENHQLKAVISMPSGVFKPYAGVSTAVLVFTKTGTGGTDKVWFYDMKADGFSLDDKRFPVKENDIEDIINRYHNLANEENRSKSDKSFFVNVDEIIEQNYDLSIKSYKEFEYDDIIHEKPSKIVEKIRVLEDKILDSLDEIERLV